LILNEAEEEKLDKQNKPIIGPTGQIEMKKILQDPPMLVFDHKTLKTRKVDP